VGKALVALDTDHIKEYVFGTDKLREIRGASSELDYLNRIIMESTAKSYRAVPIYANGGSGLFLVDAEKAQDFGEAIQRRYREDTGGGASITFVIQDLSEGVPDKLEELRGYNLSETLELLRYRLREKKNCPSDIVSLPSHPFMHLCDACGVRYADASAEYKGRLREPGEEDRVFCTSCFKKRERNDDIIKLIKRTIKRGKFKKVSYDEEYLWVELIRLLRDDDLGGPYTLPEDAERPEDFNIFRNFKGAKEYFGLIYADGNGMGKKIEKCKSLRRLHDFAEDVDTSIYEAVCLAIKKHLQIEDHVKDKNDHTFPFDILLLGGDDVLMVTPASVALDVARTIAEEFRRLTKEKEQKRKQEYSGEEDADEEDTEGVEGYTLSVGVVLAPVKYPFGLLWDLVQEMLKSTKTEGARRGIEQKIREAQSGMAGTSIDDTLINFMTVTGSTSLNFREVYASLSYDRDEEGNRTPEAFYATLRPYDLAQLKTLLDVIRGGYKEALGRTKLHQLRGAVLKKNLTTSVNEGLALLRSWRQKQREYVYRNVYQFAGRYQRNHYDPGDPASIFPRVIFPWFADGENRYHQKVYRTSLLDFVELYDFVASKEGGEGDDQA